MLQTNICVLVLGYEEPYEMLVKKNINKMFVNIKKKII